MRDWTDEELAEYHEHSRRQFWRTATNGNADNWKSAMGLFMFWGAASVAFMFLLFYLFDLLSSGTPLGGS